MAYAPPAAQHDKQCKSKVYYNGGKGKKDVNTGMFPFVIAEPEKRYGAFNQPKEGNTPGKYKGTVKRGDMIEREDGSFKHGKQFM
jgi:hypothetical protein